MRFVRIIVPTVGAAVLAGFAIASLPWREQLFRRPTTPFDRSAAKSVAPGYALLVAASQVIPQGSSVVARTEPPSPMQETYFHRFAIALLPRQRVLPAALYGFFVNPDVWKDAQYMIVVGPRPIEPPGTLILATPNGTVWRRPVP